MPRRSRKSRIRRRRLRSVSISARSAATSSPNMACGVVQDGVALQQYLTRQAGEREFAAPERALDSSTIDQVGPTRPAHRRRGERYGGMREGGVGAEDHLVQPRRRIASRSSSPTGPWPRSNRSRAAASRASIVGRDRTPDQVPRPSPLRWREGRGPRCDERRRLPHHRSVGTALPSSSAPPASKQSVARGCPACDGRARARRRQRMSRPGPHRSRLARAGSCRSPSAYFLDRSL